MRLFRPWCILVVAGLALCLCWLFITKLSHGDLVLLGGGKGFAYEVDNDLMPTVPFLWIYGIASLILILAVYGVREKEVQFGFPIILGLGLVMRLVAIPGEAIHESDYYRYGWDGMSSLRGVNPYQFEPGALYLWENGIETPFSDGATGVEWQARSFEADEVIALETLAALRDEESEWFAKVSHPAVPTIYPPAAQGLFALSASVFEWSIAGLKVVLMIFDLGNVVLILVILKHLKRSALWAVLYAWNPLVIKEFSNSAHYDAAPVFFCLAALWAALAIRGETKRALVVGFALAVGVLLKYFAVLLLPVLLFYPVKGNSKLGERIRKQLKRPSNYAGTSMFLIVIFAGFLPFAIWNEVGVIRLFEGLSVYRQHWEYNSGVFSLVKFLFASVGDSEAFRHAGWVSGGAMALVVIWQSLKPAQAGIDLARKCAVVMGALFVLGPTAFPWYLCWVVAFLPFRPSWAWVGLAVAWPLNYLDFKSPEVAPIAHASLGGIYLLSGGLWLVFALTCWVEHARGKSRCLPE